MENNWSYNKVWHFGQMIKAGHKDIPPWVGTWLDLMKDKEWKTFKLNHGLTDKQIHFIKRGFMGLPFDHVGDAATKENTESDNQIFPFGTYKGRKFSEVPDRFWVWLSKQPWFEQWPSLAVYTKTKLELLNKDSASTEDVKSILQPIK